MAVLVRDATPVVEERHVHSDSGNNSMGWVIGLILLLVVLFLFFYYGFPLLRSAGSMSTTPQVNVPGKVDVNVNKGQ